jgi:hypothetical protein
MMEQIRLSIKLEVDARAAIAERQLSAIMQLCKASSEDLDRLRVEVCANDRQLHSVDQTQSKIRQDLTTQKDICFHLQSLCGKDESWRIQADNQLLELRQMVAALREQGNCIQISLQDKLSRPELLVHFNGAIEPIKAQLNATLQHQAIQIAEATRTASSSGLLADALTKKVKENNQEIQELKNELQTFKAHFAKQTAINNGSLPSREVLSSASVGSEKANEEQPMEEILFKKQAVSQFIKEQLDAKVQELESVMLRKTAKQSVDAAEEMK